MSEGELVGGYLLRSLLGKGGVGEVWLAYDTRREREVALKLLSPELTGNAEFHARFAREARVTAQLDSVHVIPVHDFGEVAGRLFLDMRLARGGDLAAAIAAEPSGLPAWRAVTILTQLADALDTAHAAGLVHRDVKPSNVLLAGDFCYLTDFGIVKIVHETGPRREQLTARGVALGTTRYMAPELFTTGRATVHSDVYALGCVLYEMLCARPPLGGGDPAAMMYQHLHATAAPVSALRPGLAAFDPVVATALAKEPTARFATAGGLAAAAQAALRATPPEPRARPEVPAAPAAPAAPGVPAPPTGDRPWWRRGRAVALGGAGLAALLVAAVVVVLALTTSHRSGPAAAQGAQPSPSGPPRLQGHRLRLPLVYPLGIALSPDRAHAYIADPGPVNGSNGTVLTVDLAHPAVTTALAVGRDPNGVAITPDGRTLYVTNSGTDAAPGNTVSVIDIARNAVAATIPTGPEPLGIAASPDGRRVYVAVGGTGTQPGNSVAVVDTATNTVVRTVQVGSGPTRLTVSPDSSRVYVTNFGANTHVANTVSVIDAATDTVLRTVTVGDAPLGVALTPDGTRGYVANNGTNSDPRGSLTVLDLTNQDQPVTFVKSPLDAPTAVAVTPDGRKAVVIGNDTAADPHVHTAAILDTTTNTVTATVPVGRNPYAVVATDNRHAYITTDSGLWALDIP